MSQGHPITMSSGELAAYAVALGRTIAEVGTPAVADPHQFLGRVAQELDALLAEGTVSLLAGCGKTLLSTHGRKLSDDKRRPIACSERIIRIGLSHAECRRDS